MHVKSVPLFCCFKGADNLRTFCGQFADFFRTHNSSRHDKMILVKRTHRGCASPKRRAYFFFTPILTWHHLSSDVTPFEIVTTAIKVWIVGAALSVTNERWFYFLKLKGNVKKCRISKMRGEGKMNNKIVYKLYSNFMLIKELNFSVSDPWIESVKISTEHPRANILFINFTIMEEANDLEKIRQISRDVCNKIMNAISFEHRVIFGYPQEHEIVFKGDNKNRVLKGEMLAESDFPKTPNDIAVLEGKLGNLDKYSNNQTTLYRNAMQNLDKVGRFILLYSVLLTFKDTNNQTKIDNYIFELDTTVQLMDSTDSNKKERDLKYKKSKLPPGKETIYTWLRNAIGHTKEDYCQFGFTWEQIEILISQHVDPFAEIVRKALIKHR